MDRMKTARNVAIILAIAAAVDLLPGGGRAAHTFEAALWVAFAGGMAFLALRLYREHRIALHGLGHHHRALLYGAAAAGVFAGIARKHMWDTGLGELAWFVLVLGVIYALMEVFRHSRSY
jgi:hypothetical protein